MLIISILILTIIILGIWVIINLVKKLEKLEKIINMISNLIELSNSELNKSELINAFKSDDEIGFFFETILEIQNQLNEFKINK
jgi:ABC-type Na+ efflux pump permease subunit